MKVYVPMIFSAADSVLSDRGRGCYQPIISFKTTGPELGLWRWRYWMAQQKRRKKSATPVLVSLAESKRRSKP